MGTQQIPIDAGALAAERGSYTMVQRVLWKRKLRAFVRKAFSVLFPGETFVPGWHIDAICEHLEAVSARRILKLIINVPPRHMKSLLCSVFWPAWAWIRDPAEHVLSASYDQGLSSRDSTRCRRIIESPWYQANWGHTVRIADDQNEKMRFENTQGGVRLATSIGGAGTGEGGTIRILDDPHNAKHIFSDTRRQSDLDWAREVWASRVNDPLRSVEVVAMQRLHEHDMSGYYLAEVGGYEHLCLPARCEGARRCHTAVPMDGKPFVDPRAEGEPLWPARYSDAVLTEKERTSPPYVWSTQDQQTPSPKGGAIIAVDDFQRWTTVPLTEEQAARGLAHGFLEVFQSWDATFKKTKAGSFVVGQLWGVLWPDLYLLDQYRDRMGFSETIEAIKHCTRIWKSQGYYSSEILVEDKANGPAIVDQMREEIEELQEEPVPGESKVARLISCTPHIKRGHVWIPADRPWVPGFLTELSTIPFAANDDQGDAFSQAVNHALDMYGALTFEGDEETSPSNGNGKGNGHSALGKSSVAPDDEDWSEMMEVTEVGWSDDEEDGFWL